MPVFAVVLTEAQSPKTISAISESVSAISSESVSTEAAQSPKPITTVSAVPEPAQSTADRATGRDLADQSTFLQRLITGGGGVLVRNFLHPGIGYGVVVVFVVDFGDVLDGLRLYRHFGHVWMNSRKGTWISQINQQSIKRQTVNK